MLLAQAACSPIGLAVGAGASVVRASQTERGLRVQLKDLQTRAEVLHYLFQKDVDLFGAVSVCPSHKGRVCSLAKLGGLKTGLRRQNLLGKLLV